MANRHFCDCYYKSTYLETRCNNCQRVESRIYVPRHNKDLLLEYHKWLHEKNNLGEDVVMGPLSIDRFLQERES